MAFSFDATPGGAVSNSLCTVEFADDYFGGALHAAEWLALSNSAPADLLKKQQALVAATRRLERFEYEGRRATEGQRLKHPRAGLELDGAALTHADVVEQVKAANCELALHYLRNDPAAAVEEGLRQFKHLRVAGAIEMEMRDQLPSTDAVPDVVLNLIAPWLAAAASGGVRLLRA
jgi:hypothetical protein